MTWYYTQFSGNRTVIIVTKLCWAKVVIFVVIFFRDAILGTISIYSDRRANESILIFFSLVPTGNSLIRRNKLICTGWLPKVSIVRNMEWRKVLLGHYVFSSSILFFSFFTIRESKHLRILEWYLIGVKVGCIMISEWLS